MAGRQLIFISGGVRSGKSAYAESLVLEAAADRFVYLASGQAHDPEMENRIERHRQDRKSDGWTTIEQPRNLHLVLPQLQEGDAVLWDCVTTWLANELYTGWEQNELCADIPGCMEGKWHGLQNTVRKILGMTDLLIVVSNEMMDDFVRDERYQRWLGTIHIWLAAEADKAFEMENGMAYRRK